MKKKLIALLTITLLSVSTVCAAETKGPSKWFVKKTSNTVQKEQRTKAQIAADKKAIREKKITERKAKVNAKKKQLRELFK